MVRDVTKRIEISSRDVFGIVSPAVMCTFDISAHDTFEGRCHAIATFRVWVHRLEEGLDVEV